VEFARCSFERVLGGGFLDDTEGVLHLWNLGRSVMEGVLHIRYRGLRGFLREWCAVEVKWLLAYIDSQLGLGF